MSDRAEKNLIWLAVALLVLLIALNQIQQYQINGALADVLQLLVERSK